MSQPQSSHSSPDKCSVYWDYENMPISRRGELSEVVCEIRQRLWAAIGSKMPIEFKVYIRASYVTQQIQSDFDINGIVQIHVPSTKPESVDKRMLIDMAFSLYELERDRKSRAIALISGDKDFGHLLSKIHHTPPVSHSFLILLRQIQINRNLSNAVDEVIQLDFNRHFPSNFENAQKSYLRIDGNVHIDSPEEQSATSSVRREDGTGDHDDHSSANDLNLEFNPFGFHQSASPSVSTSDRAAKLTDAQNDDNREYNHLEATLAMRY